MSVKKTLRSITLAAVLVSYLISCIANAENNQQSGKRRGPPPQAIEACADQTEGEACSFTGGRSEEVTGTCIVPRRGEESLVCAPEGGPPNGHGEKSKGEL